jgi:hypothetical protein
MNEKKRREHLRRAIANKNQDKAKLNETRVLIARFSELSTQLTDVGENTPEAHQLISQIMSIISRIERVAGESATSIPGWHEWITELRANAGVLNQSRQELERTIRMAEKAAGKEKAASIVMAGTMCSVCTHRQAQVQINDLWLCKRCARGLGELPKGRAVDQ